MLQITKKRPPLDLFIVSTTKHVDLKNVTRFADSIGAIVYAKTKGHFAYHVTSKKEGGLTFEPLYPTASVFGDKLLNAFVDLKWRSNGTN